jgi:hypothetical protein
LKSDEHNHVRFATNEFVRLVVTAEHGGELADDGVLDKSTEVSATNLIAHLGFSLSSDRISELANVLNVDIRGEQSRSDFCHNFVDQLLVNRLRGIELFQSGTDLGT